MAGREHVQALMRDIGPQMGLLEVTEFAEPHVWTLVVDEETVLFVDYDDPGARLLLSAEVGEPAEAGRLVLYELLLRYNDAWRETGGGRMALDPAGVVVQQFEMAVAGLELQRLQAAVGTFVDVLRGWREILATAGRHDADASSATLTMPGGMMPGGLIRG